MAVKKSETLLKLIEGLSPKEKLALQRSIEGGHLTTQSVDHSQKFSKNLVRFGYFSDPHIGAREFDWVLWGKMCAFFKQAGIKIVYSPGDIVEGMSGRPGQIYDLEAIGFKAQVKLAAKAITMLGDIQVYSILGNHDLWFKDKAGVDASVGEELALLCKNYHHLGDWEARVTLGKGVEMLLFHANDGSA